MQAAVDHQRRAGDERASSLASHRMGADFAGVAPRPSSDVACRSLFVRPRRAPPRAPARSAMKLFTRAPGTAAQGFVVVVVVVIFVSPNSGIEVVFSVTVVLP
jgi:hypothetical protein